MSGPPPPPPPPHGENPKTTRSGGLPPGKYDVFIIPEHSAGAGFLYLPSLRTNTNSFVAGFASALALVVIGQSMAPAFRQWWSNFQGMGNVGMMMLTVAVGLGAWSLGRAQQDTSAGGAGHGGGHGNPGGGFAGASPGGYGTSSPPPPPPPHEPPPSHGSAPPPQSPPPPPPGHGSGPPPQQHQQAPPHPPEPETPKHEKPKPSWQQRPEPSQQQSSPKPETPKGAWERAREETRRKEEERRAKEEAQKKRDAAAARLKELREKEARERAQREKEKQEREAKEKAEREKKERELREELEKKEKELREMREKDQRERQLREQRAKELAEKLQRERLAQEKERLEKEKARLEQEAKEAQAKKQEEETQARKGSAYVFSRVGERTTLWPNGKPPVPAHQSPPAAAAPQPAATASQPSPSKNPPPPTARTYVDEEETYSYRPYDKPKTSHRKSNSDLSESSWAPSQSTARTTPPPSMRMPYSTKDPDKIVIRAVYGFLNQFAKTPGSQLISGQGPVTDGLILRITTEGLFIDDDVRGVPQREWDVKAWTLKQVEVWCPAHVAALMAKEEEASKKGASAAAGANPSAAFFRGVMGGSARREPRGAPKTLQGDEADAYLAEMFRECNNNCRLGRSSSDDYHHHHRPAASRSAASSNSGSRTGSTNDPQTGEWKAKGLHLLRATIRDQEGKRYLFVVGEEESWKVAVGLQRLRKGSQVRGLGVAGMSALETRTTLEMLGWTA